MDAKDIVERLRAKQWPSDNAVSFTSSGDVRQAADLIEALAAEIARLREALEEIADPIGFIQREAAAEGNQINGAMLVQIANDPAHLKRIARTALQHKDTDNG